MKRAFRWILAVFALLLLTTVAAAVWLWNDPARAVALARAAGHANAGLTERTVDIDDRAWRGFGVIPAGGYRLREEYATFDAQRRFGLTRSAEKNDPTDTKRCRAGDVLSGRLKPCDCPEFGKACTPDSPLGAPMVSSEGACAAYFRYHRGSLT